MLCGWNAAEESWMPLGMTLWTRLEPPASKQRLHAGEWLGECLLLMARAAGVPGTPAGGSDLPATIAGPLPGEARETCSPTGAGRGDRFGLRVTCLDDALLERWIDWAQALNRRPSRIETSRGAFLLEGASFQGGWNRRAPYDRIYAEASETRRAFTLKFYSPSVLDRAGRPYPLPDPAGIFRGYLERWAVLAGAEPAEGLREWIERGLGLVDFRLRMGRAGPVAGFLGSVSLRIEGRCPESVIKGLNALADYAFFCGTGRYTERGMGWTRRVGPAGEAS